MASEPGSVDTCAGGCGIAFELRDVAIGAERHCHRGWNRSSGWRGHGRRNRSGGGWFGCHRRRVACRCIRGYPDRRNGLIAKNAEAKTINEASNRAGAAASKAEASAATAEQSADQAAAAATRAQTAAVGAEDVVRRAKDAVARLEAAFAASVEK